MTEECLFCRIARGDIPVAFVAETEDAFAIRDISPKAPTHILVIPREHIDSLATVEDDALLGRLLGLAARVAREAGIAETGFRTVINTNDDGGQTIAHLHIHVLGGRHLTWPPG